MLFRRHASAIVAFAARRTGSSAAADDVTATAFEKAWRSLHVLANDGDRFRPWIFRIAANELASHHRSEQRRSRREDTVVRSTSALAGTDDPAEVLVEWPGDAPDPEELRAALDRLTPAQHEVIVLRFFSGLDAGEVADALGIARGAVAVRLHRAIAALRADLGAAPVTTHEGGAR